MASALITSWQIEGGKVEVVTDFLFLGSKITADSDCSHESKGDWQESDDKPRQCVEKQRHYSADKGPYSQGDCLPVVTFGCESWTIKKAECQRIDAFEFWHWRRLLKVPWTARISDSQS